MCIEAQRLPTLPPGLCLHYHSGETGREHRGPESLSLPWCPRVPHGCPVASAKL